MCDDGDVKAHGSCDKDLMATVITLMMIAISMTVMMMMMMMMMMMTTMALIRAIMRTISRKTDGEKRTGQTVRNRICQ